jgi:hypothetical protein
MGNQSIAPLLAKEAVLFVRPDVVSDVFVRSGPNKVQKIKDKKDRTGPKDQRIAPLNGPKKRSNIKITTTKQTKKFKISKTHH